MENLLKFDSVDEYNKHFGFETRHPLVSVIDLSKVSAESFHGEVSYNYGLYAIFLKQTKCGDITYGRQPYDYQEGTVTSFAPGQVVTVKNTANFKPNAVGLVFHPDLIRGTELGKDIKQYHFFSYSSHEALHLSEDEKGIFKDCLNKIDIELDHPVDSHSRKLICRNVELLLDYCMRFYDRQFITRKEANQTILTKLEDILDNYFEEGLAGKDGLPTVKYLAEKSFLSPNYFGDLIKKETGRTPQEYIQTKVISLAKDELLGTNKSVSDISYQLGFQYSQHFNRYFKRYVDQTPSEFRHQAI